MADVEAPCKTCLVKTMCRERLLKKYKNESQKDYAIRDGVPACYNCLYSSYELTLHIECDQIYVYLLSAIKSSEIHTEKKLILSITDILREIFKLEYHPMSGGFV